MFFNLLCKAGQPTQNNSPKVFVQMSFIHYIDHIYSLDTTGGKCFFQHVYWHIFFLDSFVLFLLYCFSHCNLPYLEEDAFILFLFSFPWCCIIAAGMIFKVKGLCNLCILLTVIFFSLFVCTLLCRSDGGVYCHSYDEGFPHGFILVRTCTSLTHIFLVSSTNQPRHHTFMC